MHQYKRYGRFVKNLAYKLHSDWHLEGEIPSTPAVFVVHHQNIRGPIRALGLMDCTARLWVLHNFTNRKECFKQYYDYTFTKRYGWAKPIAFILGGLCSLLVPPLLKSLGAIPVYRGSMDIRKTMKYSLQALYDNDYLMICPDIDYKNTTDEITQAYNGFLHLERAYYNKTKKHLAFVPISESAAAKTVKIGAPVYFEDTPSFPEQQPIVMQKILDSMNSLCR